MNDPTEPQGTTAQATPPAARELVIQIWRDWWVQYIGTAAQLQAEGLIPERFEWPVGAVQERWEAGRYDFRLRRIRPEGHKGPMRSWWGLDHWCLRVGVIGRDMNWRSRQELFRQAQELEAARRRHSAEGMAEWNAAWRRYSVVLSDKRFQSFKALVPALVPPKRGRKPRAAAPAPTSPAADPPLR